MIGKFNVTSIAQAIREKNLMWNSKFLPLFSEIVTN